MVDGGHRESREKGGVTGVTEESGWMSRGGGEGVSRHWSPSYRTSCGKFAAGIDWHNVEDLGPSLFT